MRWITALNLQIWSETLSARTVFPAMVADLIRASAKDISNIRFPNGDKGQVRGFDGVLEAAGSPPYVPEGRSIWEFGVSVDVAGKVTADYEKRTREVQEDERKQTTFVFATTRTWNSTGEKLQDFVAAKKNLGHWKDFVFIDGSMMEDWLSNSPAVAARYARFELRLLPTTGVRSTDEFWNEYSSRFGPNLVEKVLLAGREKQAETLVQRLTQGVSKLPYAADTPDEVVAFAVAAIRESAPVVRYFLEAKTLVVDTEDAARQVAGCEGLAFLPRAQARLVAGYLAQSGPTVVSAGADDKKNDHEILRRPSSTEMGKALSGMGLTEKQGYDLARRCGRSLAVLARLSPSGTAPKPEWLDSGAELLPALLAGAWHAPTKQDQEILQKLAAGADYSACEAPLRKLAKLQDPPIDYVADVWAMRASVDAFVRLGHLIGAEHLKRFSEAAKIVFGKIIEPPKEEDIYIPSAERDAGLHSNWLRDGMMNTLLHMAVLHEQAEFTIVGGTPQDYVNGIVRELPGLSSDYRLLTSLQDQMALLAEAAPIPFVEALEHQLEGDAANIRSIFNEYKGLMGSNSYHYGVLWGLEVLAWDPQLLLRAALCLARLAEIDPGGTMTNRPINSLRNIFLSWSPQTSATSKQRASILAKVLKSVPAIAWELLEKLLPASHDVSHPTQRPAFREYETEQPERLTYGLVWESQGAVIEMAITHAGFDDVRWKKIIGAISRFPKQSVPSTINALESVLASTGGDTQVAIWDALRKEVNRHQKFASADWALSGEPIDQLDSLVQKFAPVGSIVRSTWLFDDWLPDLAGIAEHEDPERAISKARLKALEEVINELGLAGIIELSKKVKLPQHVAFAARGLELEYEELANFFDLALLEGEAMDVVSGVILAEGSIRFGEKWNTSVGKKLSAYGMTAKRVAALLMALDEGIETWTYVKTFGHEIEQSYWRLKQPFFIKGDSDELMFGIENYLAHGRPLAALNSATGRMAELSTPTLLCLLDESVPEINSSEIGIGNISLYSIERAFDQLRERHDVSPDAIAALEFRYLTVFRSSTKPLVLHKLVVQQPRLFMDAICAVFKPANKEREPTAEGAENVAVRAYELLTGLTQIPGQIEDDVDEKSLLSWCEQVRQIAIEVDRQKITDQRIGALLAHAPHDKIDHAWPHKAVRGVIEEVDSEEIERGLEIERFNMRGAYSKSMDEGGDQERELARQYREWAEAAINWPRVNTMLLRISQSWLWDAERADQSAQRDALRW